MTNRNDMPQGRRLRDFLYIDAPQLRSLYAQVFERLTEDVIREHINEELTSETNTVIERRTTSERETEGMRSVRRSERGVLHDHMYNQLENSLNSVISDVTGLTEVDLVRQRIEVPFIRVQGKMEVEDYRHVRRFVDNFNRFGEAIAYGSVHSKQTLERKAALEAQRQAKLTNDQRKQLDQTIKALGSPTEHAKALGIHQDPQLLENLKFMIDLFEDQAYHIIIANNPTDPIRFRGIIDPNFLRIEPWRIRSLYGNQSSAAWTMVGSVTFIPKTFEKWSYPADATDQMVNEELQLPSLLDALRNMTRSARSFEQAFLESSKAFEVVMSPLAIYREFTLDNQ